MKVFPERILPVTTTTIRITYVPSWDALEEHLWNEYRVGRWTYAFAIGAARLIPGAMKLPEMS